LSARLPRNIAVNTMKTSKTAARPKTSKQLVHDFMKEQIFNAVVSAAEKKSWAVVSIDDVIEEMGASKGTIYHYFKSKKELMIAMWLNQQRQVYRELLPISHDKTLKPAARLEATIRNHVLLLCRNWRANKAIWASALLTMKWDEEADKELMAERQMGINGYIKMIRALHPGDRQNPVLYEYLATAVIQSIEAVMLWYQEPFPLTAEQLAEMMSGMLMQGLLKKPG